MLASPFGIIALFCPCCGQLHKEKISRFRGYAGSRLELRCRCGTTVGTLHASGTGGHGRWQLEISCQACSQVHALTVLPDVLFGRVRHEDIRLLYCKESFTELGYYGSELAVSKFTGRLKCEYNRWLHREQRSSSEDERKDEILDPEIMLAVFNRLDELVASHAVECSCGREALSVAILADRIVLCCDHCGASVSIRAAEEADRESLLHTSQIRLLPPAKLRRYIFE